MKKTDLPLTPESLADTLAALARIKAVDAGAPGLDPHTTYWLKRMAGHDVRPKGSVMNQAECDRNALAHLLDVCMGVMGWARRKGYVCRITPCLRDDGVWWMTSIRNSLTGRLVPGSDTPHPTHLSAACAVVRAIAGVVGEKEGASDE